MSIDRQFWWSDITLLGVPGPHSVAFGWSRKLRCVRFIVGRWQVMFRRSGPHGRIAWAPQRWLPRDDEWRGASATVGPFVVCRVQPR